MANKYNSKNRFLQIEFNIFHDILFIINCHTRAGNCTTEVKNEGEITKMALLLAQGVVNSRLSYASYPEIIDENKNPLILYFKKTGTFDTCTFLLLTSNEEGELDDFSNPQKAPYKKLSYCTNGNISEQYRLERLIIAIGEGKNDQKLVAPYVHNFN